MTKHLTKMALDKVSLVDRGANDRRFAVLKNADRKPMVSDPDAVEENKGLVAKIAEALGVSKADTFGDMVARRDASAAADDGFDLMESAFWTAQYAVDANGDPLSPEGKRALVKTSLDQFSAYLLDAMTVEKAGKKQFSTARMSRLKDAMRVLNDVIEGVEEGWWSPPEGAVAKESDEMNEQEIRDLVAKTVEDQMAEAMKPEGPLVMAMGTAVTEAVTKAVEAAKPETPEAPAAPEPQDGDVTLATLTEAVSKLADRVNDLSGSRSQQMDVGEAPVAKQSPFAGILG